MPLHWRAAADLVAARKDGHRRSTFTSRTQYSGALRSDEHQFGKSSNAGARRAQEKMARKLA